MVTGSTRSWFFCFKQKTAYEMRISDWSSDVCSSDLPCADRPALGARRYLDGDAPCRRAAHQLLSACRARPADRHGRPHSSRAARTGGLRRYLPADVQDRLARRALLRPARLSGGLSARIAAPADRQSVADPRLAPVLDVGAGANGGMGGTPPDQRRRERSPAIYGARRRSGAAHLQPARGLCRDDACAAALLHPAALWGDEGHRPDGDARRELARRTAFACLS